MSTERVIVHRAVAARLRKNLRTQFEKISAGDRKSGSKVSPLVSLAFAERFEAYLKEAEKEGAKFLLGDLKREGAVIQPHIVTNVKPHMQIWQRESFGPGTSTYLRRQAPSQMLTRDSCEHR